ncbi:acyl-CoA N-acyltransferase [Wolfiporia cocos MD-104 SS10]|uniref:Acyl-CoA N-acyltransferase n=1 Tax=Wolfiporia cocos (strain MD-104) TaxID=742152 RepID=A0A2H3JVJ4_WOLCO|nr:acyl-CoA N-acyltransferase [Wolfiporia cocos MD-104 SS10]
MPRLILAEADALHAAFEEAFTQSVMMKMIPLMAVPTYKVLHPPSAAYFARAKELETGLQIQEFSPDGAIREMQWKELQEAFAKMSQWMSMDGTERQFFMGDKTCYADITVASWMVWMKRCLGANSHEWAQVETWDGGRWGRFMEYFEQYAMAAQQTTDIAETKSMLHLGSRGLHTAASEVRIAMIIDTSPETSGDHTEPSSEVPVIRYATPADIEELAPLFLASVDTSLPGITFSARPGYELAKICTHLETRLFPTPTIRTFCLELPSSPRIIGYASVKPKSTVKGLGDTPELDMLFVKVGMAGRGYGGLLMERVQRECRETGLGVHVFKRNERALRFYHKWGFAIVVEEEMNIGEGNVEQVYGMRWAPT